MSVMKQQPLDSGSELERTKIEVFVTGNITPTWKVAFEDSEAQQRLFSVEEIVNEYISNKTGRFHTSSIPIPGPQITLLVPSFQLTVSNARCASEKGNTSVTKPCKST